MNHKPLLKANLRVMTTDGKKQKLVCTMHIIITVNRTSATDSYYFWVIAIGQALF